MHQPKPFEELTLADNFLFCQVMKCEPICRHFLESLLDIRLQELQYVAKQSDLTDSLLYRGNVLDIRAKDAVGNFYDIEMQNKPLDYMDKRLRAYAAAMDREMLRKGDKVENLPQNIVIAVCSFDPGERGLARYEVWKQWGDRDMGIALDYDDGAHVYYLNTTYTTANAPEDILDFLQIVKGNPARTDFGTEVNTKLIEVKNDNDIKEAYMTVEEYAYDRAYIARKEGRAEGLAEGREEAIRQSAAALQKLGMPMEQIAAVFEITVEELQRILQEPKKD